MTDARATTGSAVGSAKGSTSVRASRMMRRGSYCRGSIQRRVVGGGQEYRVYLGDNPAVDLRFRRHLLPLGIVLERRPALLGGLAALVREQVDELILGGRGVHRREIDDVGHPVLLEDAQRVIAEAGVQLAELAVGRGVGSQLEHAGGCLRAERMLGEDAGSEAGHEEQGGSESDAHGA